MAELRWKKFNAMGTEVVISAFLEPEEESLLEEAQAVVLEFEKRFSRFIKGNELDKLNTFSGKTLELSGMMADLLKEAKNLHKETHGVFDPTVIGPLEEIGYDKSFEKIKENEKGKKINVEKIRKDFLSRPKIDEIKISENKVVLPKGLKVDFGGIGKGYIADFLGEHVFEKVDNFWISAGGDLLVRGDGHPSTGSGQEQGEKGWKIGVQDPSNPQRQIFSINTKGESLGVATSGVFKRKGIKGGFEWHHIIDPRTGLPVKNDILAVTVISSSARRADVFAKTVLILGEKEGLEFIESQKDSVCLIFFSGERMAMSQGALKYF